MVVSSTLQELCKQAEKDRMAQEAHHLSLYQRYKVEQADRDYSKYYQMAAAILNQVVDLATKFAEYRELTEKLVPFDMLIFYFLFAFMGC